MKARHRDKRSRQQVPDSVFLHLERWMPEESEQETRAETTRELQDREEPFSENLLLCWALAQVYCPSKRLSGSRVQAHFAAQNLSDRTSKFSILRAAEANDKRFFIDLGKILSGDMKPDLHDRTGIHVAIILSLNPSITAKNAVQKLKSQNVTMSEENFRVWKKRLKDLSRKLLADPGFCAMRRRLNV
jgi:hypothetical protein